MGWSAISPRIAVAESLPAPLSAYPPKRRRARSAPRRRERHMASHVIRSEPRRAGVTKLLESAALPTADLTDAHMKHFFFAGTADNPTGVVGLELCGSDALLRSLVVAKTDRSTGLGAALTE